jgi:hypothetical protein
MVVDGTLRVTNYASATRWFLLAIVFGPFIGAFSLWWSVPEFINAVREFADLRAILVRFLAITLFPMAAAASMYRAFFQTPLWVEFGEDVCLRRLFGCRRFAWNELAPLAFETEERTPRLSILLFFGLNARTLLLRDTRGRVVARVCRERPLYAAVFRFLQERRAAAQIDALGGSVTWEGSHVVAVSLRSAAIDDASLSTIEPALHSFPKMTALDLRGTQVTDGGLASLADLENLEDIGVIGSQITTEGLQQWRAQKQFRF